MARREIGVLASSKMTGRTHRIIAPAEQEKAMRYARRTTDYSILDNIGIYVIMLKHRYNNVSKYHSNAILSLCVKSHSLQERKQRDRVVSLSDS